MFQGCKVLDLCCGDGSYSYLFFSDIAGKIDAVDNDADALAYAKRCFAAPVIAFHNLDIVEQGLPDTGYDFVVWNAALCYFSSDAIVRILEKIAACGKGTMILCGMVPRASGYVDHKTEFSDKEALEELLRGHFGCVTIREVEELFHKFFYFKASAPLHAF